MAKSKTRSSLPSMNPKSDRFRKGFKVNKFVTEYNRRKDQDGETLLFCGPTLEKPSGTEAKITVQKLNQQRRPDEKLRVVNA